MRRLFPLMVLFLVAAGCGRQQQTIELRFVATLDGTPAACADSGFAMSDLRFYVSEVALSEEAKPHVAANIVDRAPWQNADVALIDLENGAGSCQNGTPLINDTVVVAVPHGDYRLLAFTVGVPFERNHSNPLTAATPLNDSAMHWHWRSGYKFLRSGIVNDDFETWIHLGSTGCEGTVGNITGCNSPNRVYVELAGFDPATDRVAVDLSVLLDTQAMKEAGDRTDCSSGPAEKACEAPFAALGLPFEGTAPTDAQQVFSIFR